jgi:hypothetical protein
MAYFAQLDDNNTVVQVIAISNDDAPDPFPESEAVGQAFIAQLGLTGEWRQTSYHGRIRYNYASIGYSYDAQRDAFISPQPWPSWVLDGNICKWQPPIPYPDDGNTYTWDEDTLSWVEVDP